MNPITVTFNTSQIDINYSKPIISLYSLSSITVTNSPTDLPFTNQNIIDTSTFSHNINGSNIIIKSNGRYEITGIVSTDTDGPTSEDGRSVSAFSIYRSIDSGSIFNAIPGTNAFMYNREANNGENTGVAKVIISLTENDIIKIQARRISGIVGNTFFIPNSCSLHIKKLQ